VNRRAVATSVPSLSALSAGERLEAPDVFLAGGLANY